MASDASATPPPQVNLSQEALQSLAGTVYELLKDSIIGLREVDLGVVEERGMSKRLDGECSLLASEGERLLGIPSWRTNHLSFISPLLRKE